MKIHQVVATEEPRYDVDPVRGVILRTETTLKPGGASVISAADHGEFEIGEDGAFDVPDELGHAFLNQPGWFEGVNPFASLLAKAAAAAEAEDDEEDDEEDDLTPAGKKPAGKK